VSIHGGDIAQYIKKYGYKKNDIIDFSANINPLGPPMELKECILKQMEDIHRYPDIEYTTLKNSISGYLKVFTKGVGIEQIIPGNGATELIYLYFMYNKFAKVLIPSPAFSDYYGAVNNSGSEIVYMRLREENDFIYDAEEIIDSLKKDNKIECLVLCNPHNPTSALAGMDTLVRLLEYTCNNGISLFIDETFIELTVEGNSSSTVKLIQEYNNLFILRAFTKILSIPGLRLGYGISNPSNITGMLKQKMPWSINCMAEGISAFLGMRLIEEYLNKTQKWLSEEINYLHNELIQMKWLKAYRPNTNFILLKIQSDRLKASDVKENLIKYSKILIRDASNFKYLDESYFRVAIKGREENKMLIKAMGECVL